MRTFVFPLVVVALIAALLLSLEGLRAGRSERRDRVVNTIAENAGGAIEVVTPLLFVTVEERFKVPERRARDASTQSGVVREESDGLAEKVETSQHAIVAHDVQVKIKSDVETRSIGIFPGRVQNAKVAIAGTFTLPKMVLSPRHLNGHAVVASAHLRLHLGQLSTLGQISSATLGERALAFEPASEGFPELQLLTAEVPTSLLDAAPSTPFAVTLALRGGSSFALRPLAEQSTVELEANWAHPDFSLSTSATRGRVALPSERQFAESSTKAVWLLSGLSAGLKPSFAIDSPAEYAHLLEASATRVGVDFVEPVDVFLRVERSIKYGALLIAVCMSLLWAITLKSRGKTHLMHFALMSISLVLFFLLLLSLAEKIDFLWAYGVSAIAIVALNTINLGGVLSSTRQSFIANAPTGLSYAALYGLLVSEDHALLLGSVLVFGLFASVMMLTRRVDWNTVFSS